MRSLVAMAVASLLIVGVSVASDAEASIKRFTNIEAQGLEPALNAWARERDLQLVYRSDVVGALTTAGAVGELTAEEALGRLLNGTGLTYRYLNKNTITIVPIAAAPAATGSNVSLKRSAWRLAQAESNGSGNQTAGGSGGDSATTNSSERNGFNLEEVVVTAQKREERLQEVPMSVSVLSGAELDRSTAEGLTEALNRVPGVAAAASFQGGGTQMAIRGVTSGGPTFNGSSPVAYYLDSVPFGLVKTAIAPDANAYDMERVEVLRGPQGTLYGASAQNGVVRILTRDAQLDQVEFKARTSASSTDAGGDNFRGDAAFNLPIVPGKFAARAVVGYQDLSGWIDRPNDKDANDAQIQNFRLKLQGRPSEQLTVGLSAWLSRADYGAPSSGLDGNRNSSLEDESISTDYDVFGLKVGYDFGAASLSSMTSYLDYKNTGNLDLTPTNFPALLYTGLDADVFAQELLLSSTSQSAWRWSVGAFYRDAEDRLRQNNLGGGAPFDYANGSESYALFGEISRRFLDDRFAWTLGLRYFHDEVFVKENVNQGQPGDPLQDNRDSFDSTTPRAVLTWYPSDSLTVYASYSEGFRSGFDQDPGVLRPNPNFPSAKPDKLRNYELGAKADFAGGLVSLESAVYFIDWQSVQQSLAVPFEGTAITALVNGKSASGLGVDVGITARPLDSLQLGINASWNDLTMDSPVISSGVVLFDKGERLNLSPEYTAGAWADYSVPVGGSGYHAQFSASANYVSAKDWRTIWGGVQSLGYGEDQFVGRLSIALQSPGRWVTTLFADNVTNEGGIVAIAPFPVTPDWAARIRPRTVGVQFEYRL